MQTWLGCRSPLSLPEEKTLVMSPNKTTENDHSLIFLHIPRTGGSMLHWVIKDKYEKYEPATIFTIDGNRFKESVREFKRLPEEQRKRIRVLKGHMYFGLHEFLPRPSSYITILRDPIERVISAYYHILQNPTQGAHKVVTSQRMSLAEFVRTGVCKMANNGQTRFLSGEPEAGEDIPYGAMPSGNSGTRQEEPQGAL